MIYELSKTYSHIVSAEILANIEKASPTAKKYLENIPSNQWRSSSWRDNQSLPPRYGVVTSNMSESTNNMFEGARTESWLLAIDFMLGRMMERITTLRARASTKNGVVDHVVATLTQRWDGCAGYEVLEVESGGSQFTIVRQHRKAFENRSMYNIDIMQRRCTCGEWQDHELPCIDALAYYRLYEKITLNDVLERHVNEKYTYGNEREMLAINIVPVCLETIIPDGLTLPPKQSTKRSTGRPKKVRIRKRSRWSHDPEKSNVVCSKCKQRGHNIKTCDVRAWMLKEAEKKKKKKKTKEDEEEPSEVNELDLS